MDDKELPEALHAAHVDTRRIRGELVDVESGRADAQHVIDSLTDHWREHGRTYQRVGRIVFDQVRVQLLAQLYGWREQLNQQLESRRQQ